MAAGELRPAAMAFDAIADIFDLRFGAWASVAAQRRAVRTVLLKAFSPKERILELGGGTGEDAEWLAAQGYDVLMTDVSPAMVAIARAKLAGRARAEIVAAEDLEGFAATYLADGGAPFDGAFSNFAGLNCITDLTPVARGLARLTRTGGNAVLVLFGPFPPGEVVVEMLRGRPGSAFRRLKRGQVQARLGKQRFAVVYHRPGEIDQAMEPWFRPVRRSGIGVFVPPSAAEPWITAHPSLLDTLEKLDRTISRLFPLLGDHVLYHYQRTDFPPP